MSLCEARRAGTALELPHKAALKARRIEPVTVVLAEDAEERFLLQQRPEKGLLAGLWQPLLWEGEALSAEEVCGCLLYTSELMAKPGRIHIVTEEALL